MQETWIQSLGWEDPLEKGNATHSRILAGESPLTEGYSDSLVGSKSTCNAEYCDFPGLERSPGEGIGYQLQYSWGSLVAQLVKNLPAM